MTLGRTYIKFLVPYRKRLSTIKITWNWSQTTPLTLLHTGHITLHFFRVFVHFYTPFAFSPNSIPHLLIRLYFPLNCVIFPCPFLHTNTHSDSSILLIFHYVIWICCVIPFSAVSSHSPTYLYTCNPISHSFDCQPQPLHYALILLSRRCDVVSYHKHKA